MKVSQSPHLTSSVLLLVGALACRAPEKTSAPALAQAVPETWAMGASTGTGAPQLAGWWDSFSDPELTAIINATLSENIDLRTAHARLAGAEAQARIAGAILAPSLSAGGNVGRSRQNFIGFPIPGGDQQVLSSTTSNFGVSLDVTWEVDLWGKLDARARAAGTEYQASQADFAGIQLSLAGQAAKSWFALTEARLQRENTARTVEAYEQSTQVLRGRFAQRGTAALDLRLAEAQLASGKALLAAYEESLERVARQVEFLTGQYPQGSPTGSEDLPKLPPMVPALLPSELLQRRPDLVAAETRLKSANLHLYAARMDLYPSLSLSASAGRRGSEAGDMGDSDFDVWSLAGNLTAPIFQGGRLAALVDFEEAGVQAALYDWSSAILRAFLEVETALASEAPLARREANLEVATRHAEAARALAEQRYLAGRNDILIVLEARQRAFLNRSAQISARRALLDLRVDLFLALGGGFDAQQVPEGTTAP